MSKMQNESQFLSRWRCLLGGQLDELSGKLDQFGAEWDQLGGAKERKMWNNSG